MMKITCACRLFSHLGRTVYLLVAKVAECQVILAQRQCNEYIYIQFILECCSFLIFQTLANCGCCVKCSRDDKRR